MCVAHVYCSVLQCVAVCCSVLQCIAESCNVLQFVVSGRCVAVHAIASARGKVCCSVLQCVAVCCSVLQCVAMYYSVLSLSSVLQCTQMHPQQETLQNDTYNTRLASYDAPQHTATHFNTLRHTATHATHCTTLQHTATHCNTPNEAASYDTQSSKISIMAMLHGKLSSEQTFENLHLSDEVESVLRQGA